MFRQCTYFVHASLSSTYEDRSSDAMATNKRYKSKRNKQNKTKQKQNCHPNIRLSGLDAQKIGGGSETTTHKSFAYTTTTRSPPDRLDKTHTHRNTITKHKHKTPSHNNTAATRSCLFLLRLRLRLVLSRDSNCLLKHLV